MTTCATSCRPIASFRPPVRRAISASLNRGYEGACDTPLILTVEPRRAPSSPPAQSRRFALAVPYAAQRAARVPRAPEAGCDGVVEVRAGALQAVDVPACARGSAAALTQVVVVAVRDAVQLQRPVAGGAELPASRGLSGVHDDHDVPTLATGGQIAAPGSRQGPAVCGVGQSSGRGDGAGCHDHQREKTTRPDEHSVGTLSARVAEHRIRYWSEIGR